MTRLAALLPLLVACAGDVPPLRWTDAQQWGVTEAAPLCGEGRGDLPTELCNEFYARFSRAGMPAPHRALATGSLTLVLGDCAARIDAATGAFTEVRECRVQTTVGDTSYQSDLSFRGATPRYSTEVIRVPSTWNVSSAWINHRTGANGVSLGVITAYSEFAPILR